MTFEVKFHLFAACYTPLYLRTISGCQSLGCLALYLSLAVLYVLICIYLLGLTSSERRIMYNFVKTNINCILNFLRV